MNSLGIYFGPKVISIVEVKGKKLLNSIQIPTSIFSSIGSEDKVPEEIKVVTLFKDRLRNSKIESKEASLLLSGKDLIIRTFNMPFLPAKELPTAINFEAKKYIPFKIEELVSTYQVQLDKLNKRYSVLFAGIKKDILEKYISIFNQLEIKLSLLEYSAFSILRLMELSGFKEKAVVGVINIDSQESDEADFTVLDNGFPLFSCDIKLPPCQLRGEVGSEDVSKDSKIAIAAFEKLKSEIRISLDYYNHKLPLKKIKQIFLIASPDCSANVESFLQEIGLSCRTIDPSRIIGEPVSFSLSFFKAYSSALSATVKTAVTINILSSRRKSRQQKAVAEQAGIGFSLPALISGFRLNPGTVILAALILSLTLIYGVTRKRPLEKELNDIISLRPKVAEVSAQATYEELTNMQLQYKDNLIVMEKLLKQQPYLTPYLSAITYLIPDGLWLENFSLHSTEKETGFNLTGNIYLGNSTKELQLLNSFLLSLKNDKTFNSRFKGIEIVSVDMLNVLERTVTRFVISGKDANHRE